MSDERRGNRKQVSTHVSKFGYKREKRNMVVVGGKADQGIVFFWLFFKMGKGVMERIQLKGDG